jgi:tetratricopeptide (TPR) repeat protein
MRYRSLSGLLGLLMFGLTLTTAAVRADEGATAAENEERARGHFRLGRAHYDNGDFARAAVEFEEAYRISQRAALLYNIYLAYRDANDTRNAAEALRKYLALEKNIENRGQLESRLAALDRSLAENPQPSAAPALAAGATTAPAQPLTPAAETAPAEAAPAAALATSEPSQAEKPFPVVPVVLMGTGGAMLVGSIVTGLMAVGKHSEWEEAKKDCDASGSCSGLSQAEADELNDLKSSGQTLAIVTDILLFGGLAVAGTGVALFFLSSGDESAPAPSGPQASLACGPLACRVQGSF